MIERSQSMHPDLEFSLTLTEISHCCGVSTEKVLTLIAEGILSPEGAGEDDWRFGSVDLDRALRALRLERDLVVNPAGAALAVELLGEMQRLRDRIRLLEGLLFER